MRPQVWMDSVSSSSIQPSPVPSPPPLEETETRSKQIPSISRMQRQQSQPPATALPQIRLCNLELLPAELLEKIFFYSLEINLPRASLQIAHILSKPIIYKWLIRLAFSSPNKGSRHDFFTPDFLPPPLDYWSLSTTQRANLQTAILECRWSTLDLFRQCQKDYVRHILRKKCAEFIFTKEELDEIDESLNEPPMKFDLGVEGRRGSGDLVLKVKAKNTESGNSIDRNPNWRLAVWFHFGAVQLTEQTAVSYELDLFRLPCAPSLDEPPRMPEKLLQKPWTDEKIEFLTLFSLDAYIDEDNHAVRSRHVLRQLIRDRDYKTFETLLGMYIKTKNYSYPQPWPVKLRHFQTALNHAEGPNDPFLKLLHDTRWDTLGSREQAIKDQVLEILNLGPVRTASL